MISIFITSWRFNWISNNVLKHPLYLRVIIILFDILYQLIMWNRFIIGFNVGSDNVLWFFIMKNLFNSLCCKFHATRTIKMITILIHDMRERQLELLEY